MAAIVCWKSGAMDVYETKEIPEGTIPLAHGTESLMRSVMVRYGVAGTGNQTGMFFVPGVRELGEETGDNLSDGLLENQKFELVQDFQQLLAEKRSRV